MEHHIVVKSRWSCAALFVIPLLHNEQMIAILHFLSPVALNMGCFVAMHFALYSCKHSGPFPRPKISSVHEGKSDLRLHKRIRPRALMLILKASAAWQEGDSFE